MITVLDVIKLSTDYLSKKNIESPRVNAEILLAKVLQCKRLDLYLSFDKPLNEIELNEYRELLRKRSARIPLQYLIGDTDFYSLNLIVNENVLIPRPETELLVETILKNQEPTSELKILDIGSGSGNISLALAKNLPKSFVTGIDISDKAIDVSLKNKERNNLENVEFIFFDILKDDITKLGKFDFIVSNPPYVSKDDFELLEPELKVYEPKIALTDDSDGITFYKEIVSKSHKLLNKPGFIYFELGKGLYQTVNQLMSENKFSNIEIIKDYSGIERIISGEMK
jgi:release factor glutamine methyltransferase